VMERSTDRNQLLRPLRACRPQSGDMGRVRCATLPAVFVLVQMVVREADQAGPGGQADRWDQAGVRHQIRVVEHRFTHRNDVR